ncbi:uncharacterized protein BDCG_05560 [Blastomyces dermatitidis ER-3]|uniref:Uncharacterized protein n=1 Tax=Ajellomyces dermatitidis (strain ER-3 / ATCC MYA-2586) TaxID=559297 RepID=A0ABP2F3A4_AJEDR|nr:uncharacterized protein BDCG_05560 [Blastomyces dermatitidis ER-3]EEQ90440.1 hypothetical protein BDCG_05560 [Blastomyces dermatitidis ER-3]
MRIVFFLFNLMLSFHLAAVASGAAVMMNRSVKSKKASNDTDSESQPPGLSDPAGKPSNPNNPDHDELHNPGQKRWDPLGKSFIRRGPLKLPPSECKKHSCKKDDECKFLGCTFCHFTSNSGLGYCI